MPIPFNCPHCGNQSLVDDRFAGQSGPCGKCGQTITISGFAAPPPPSSSGAGWIIGILAIVGVGGICVIGILVALLLPALQAARGAARKAQSQNNLRQITLALLNYDATHGSFPPAVVRDSSGKALYSWRVLILPYLEQQAAFDQFDKSKAWDDPANIAISTLHVPTYHAPADSSPNYHSSYFAMVHPQGIFNDQACTKFSEITDGLSNTLLVIEAHGSNVSWAAPCEIDATTMQGTNNFPFAPKLAPDSKNAVIALGDGSVHSMPQTELLRDLPLLIQRDDGQVVPSLRH
jgi:type II secretory pathway pseudopilin PulG